MDLIEKIRQLAKREDYDLALDLCDQEIATSSDLDRLYSARAYVNYRKGDSAQAIADINLAIEKNPKEPHYFYIYGIYLFECGRYDDAIKQFSTAIQLSKDYGSVYYLTPSYFFRADCYVRLKEYEKALADCENIPQETAIWTDRLKSKSEIILQANEPL